MAGALCSLSIFRFHLRKPVERKIYKCVIIRRDYGLFVR